MMSATRWLDRLGFVGASGGILASSAYQAFALLSLRIKIASFVFVIIVFQAVLSSITVTVFVGVSGTLFGAKLWLDHRSGASEESGDHLTAIVPVYRDAGALHRSVESLLASAYDDLSVVIVCEPDDEASRRRAASFADHDRVDLLVNGASERSKASAINYAVERTSSRYLGVFDADERVDPSFVGHAVAMLDEYDVVQGRTVPEPTGAIESIAYYESVLLNYVGRRLLYVLTGFRMASSRAIVMRRSAFESVGGYDPAMLTEDFEFAYRCYRERLSVRETLAHASRIEAAHSLQDWWGQRKRWMRGYTQVFHRLLASLDPFDYRALLSVAFCAMTVLGNPLMLSLLSKFFVLMVVDAEAWFLPPIAAVLTVTLAVRLFDVRTADVSRPGPFWLVAPVLLPLYGLTMIKALSEYLFSGRGSWYSVEKS